MVSIDRESRYQAEKNTKKEIDKSKTFVEKELEKIEEAKRDGNPIRIKFLTRNCHGTEWIWVNHEQFLKIKNIIKKI